MTYSAKDKLNEVRRELRMRRHKYPAWIEAGTLDRPVAEKQLAVLEDIERDYIAIIETIQPKLDI